MDFISTSSLGSQTAACPFQISVPIEPKWTNLQSRFNIINETTGNTQRKYVILFDFG